MKPPLIVLAFMIGVCGPAAAIDPGTAQGWFQAEGGAVTTSNPGEVFELTYAAKFSAPLFSGYGTVPGGSVGR